MSVNARGVRCARTIARGEKPGSIFLTITQSRALIVGMKIAWPPTPVFCPGPLERTRRDPQGASFWPDRKRRQSRRRRQRVLLLPRFDTYSFLHEVSVQNIRRPRSLCADSQETASVQRPSQSTSCSTPAYSMATAILMSFVVYGQGGIEDICIFITVAIGAPKPPRFMCCQRYGSGIRGHGARTRSCRRFVLIGRAVQSTLITSSLELIGSIVKMADHVIYGKRNQLSTSLQCAQRFALCKRRVPTVIWSMGRWTRSIQRCAVRSGIVYKRTVPPATRFAIKLRLKKHTGLVPNLRCCNRV